MSDLVHYSDWASQPDIRIACDQSMTTPAWSDGTRGALTDIANVYRTDDERLYTFEGQDKVTCPTCFAMAPAAPTEAEIRRGKVLDAVLQGQRRRGIEEGRRLERQRLLGTPEFRSFADGVVLEAQHQRQRWGTEHDAGKTDADWFWLLGWLGGKAVHNPLAPGENADEKRLHRIITAAAALANWHAQILGQSNMRPGIAPPAGAQEGASL